MRTKLAPRFDLGAFDCGESAYNEWLVQHAVNAVEAVLAAAVTRARQAGASWSAIGARIGVSRQGAQQRFTRASAHESTNSATRAY